MQLWSRCKIQTSQNIALILAYVDFHLKLTVSDPDNFKSGIRVEAKTKQISSIRRKPKLRRSLELLMFIGMPSRVGYAVSANRLSRV